MARGAKKGCKNPNAGRKKGSVNMVKKKIQELAQPYGEKALEVLNEIMMRGSLTYDVEGNITGGAKDGDRIAAAKELLDRAYGKAPQAITGEDGEALKVSFEVLKK